MIVKKKAFAYITKADQLLVFEHPLSPEAGIQVPAGTIEPGVDPTAAALREAYEETGLDNLRLSQFFGTCEWDLSGYGLQEIHQRYFYHLLCDGDAPPMWIHVEADPSDGSAPMPFRLYWVRLPDWLPVLAGGHDCLLHRVIPSVCELST